MMAVAQYPLKVGTTCSPRFFECNTANPRLDSFITVRFELANKDNPTDKAIADLHAVVGAIQNGRLLPVSQDMGHLLTRAVQVQGPPRDIHRWASQLASEVCDLND